MKRNILLVGLVAAMLLLSGCSGMFGNGPNGADAEPNSTKNTLDTDVHEKHITALQDSGSFNATYALSIVPEDSNSTKMSEMDVQTNYRVDMGDKKYLSTEESTQASIQTYTASNTTYQQIRISGAENASYRMASAPYANGPRSLQPFDINTAAGSNLLLVENVTYQQSHKAPYGEDGNTSVTVYEAAGEDAIATMQEQLDASTANDTNVTIVEFTAIAKVDDNGILRHQSIEYTINESGTTYTTSVTHDIPSVGGITVNDPEWLDAAKNQTATTNSTDERSSK